MIPSGGVLDVPIARSLRCPRCRAVLQRSGDDSLTCCDGSCARTYPVRDGIPILLHEERSLFSACDQEAPRDTRSSLARRLGRWVDAMLPDLSANVRARQNIRIADECIRKGTARPQVLIVGGGRLGEGLDHILKNPAYDIVESDIYLGPRTNLVCDAHDLPFADSTFDGVVIQAVLHALVDPARAVSEIHRTLKPRGIIYAEAPFMQQNCEGRYDFYRFSHLGLRRLLRGFEEIRSGAQAGPGMAAAWAYQYFLYSLTTTRVGRLVAHVFGRLTAWWLVYIDHLVIDRRSAIDAASGVYFLGRRSDAELSDREIIRSYRGAVL